VQIKTQWGHDIIVDPCDFIGRYIFIEGAYEEDCTHIFRQFLREGDCVLDIGSNIGYFSLLGASLVGAGGRCIPLKHPRRQ